MTTQPTNTKGETMASELGNDSGVRLVLEVDGRQCEVIHSSSMRGPQLFKMGWRPLNVQTGEFAGQLGNYQGGPVYYRQINEATT